MKEKEPQVKKTTKSSKKKAKTSTKTPSGKAKKKTTVKVKEKKKQVRKVKKPSAAKPAAKKVTVKKPVKKIKAKGKTEKKTTAKKTKPVEKVSKRISKEVPLPRRKVAKVPTRTLKTIEEQAEILKKPMEEIKKTPSAMPKGLPVEYGENRITLMVVDPWKLFAYWEVRQDTAARVKGILILRVYDVTGIYFDGKNANIVFDLAVFDRVGDSYIGVGQGRDFIVDIGAISKKGEFTTIARSNKVTTPALPSLKVAKEEGVLPKEIYETGPVIGYS